MFERVVATGPAPQTSPAGGIRPGEQEAEAAQQPQEQQLHGFDLAGRFAQAEEKLKAAEVLTRAAALAGLEIAEGETLSFLPYEWPAR